MKQVENTPHLESVLIKSTALANDKRLQILALLKEPSLYFSDEQWDQNEGVCGLYIAEKLLISKPTASSHLKILGQAGFLIPTRIGKYTYFKRDELALNAFSELIQEL